MTSPTEFSFGGATNCSACPEGWVRNDVTFMPVLHQIYYSRLGAFFSKFLTFLKDAFALKTTFFNPIQVGLFFET